MPLQQSFTQHEQLYAGHFQRWGLQQCPISGNPAFGHDRGGRIRVLTIKKETAGPERGRETSQVYNMYRRHIIISFTPPMYVLGATRDVGTLE